MNSQAQELIEIAENEVGYLEKASNSQLDDKTANAGSGNWTKYGAWYNLNGYPWCAIFISWCVAQAGIPNTVIPKFSSSTLGMEWFKAKSRWTKTPEAGDIIFFTNGDPPTQADHAGIVRAVDGGRVYTVEGNTSGGSKLIINGGAVANKAYALAYDRILGYGHPDYKEVENMTGEEIYNKLTAYLQTLPTSDYAAQASRKGVATGVFSDGNGDGLVDDPQGYLRRQDLAVVLDRLGLLDK